MPDDGLRLREADIRAELPKWAENLRRRARRFRSAATRSEKAGTGNLRAPALRVVAQALVDAADLLEHREFLITLRPRALCYPGEARGKEERRKDSRGGGSENLPAPSRLTPSPT